MKKLTLILSVISIICLAQPTVSVDRITPDTVCAGDSIKIDYKATWPTSPDNTTNYFILTPGSTIIWSGNWAILKARHKEHYPALAVGDSAYWIKIKVPLGTAPGNYSVTSNAGMSYKNKLYIKNCACSITANFTYTLGDNGAVTFSSSSIGTTSNTVYSWYFGTGSTYTLPASVTNTYIANGTYSVNLMVSNPTCTDQITIAITVTSIGTNTVDTGIPVYELNRQKPIYFDIYGNRIEPRSGELIIEQSGTKRRKIIMQD